MTAVDLLLQNPDIPRGNVKIGFTPDEEIGRGADKFDVKRFGAQFAYTMDGGRWARSSTRRSTRTAQRGHRGLRRASGLRQRKARQSHPHHGYFITRLPRELSPEMTDQRDGYIHPYVMSGQDKSASLRLLLRDFRDGGIEKQKKIIEGIADEVRKLHPKAKINVDIKES
jgi:tripeptide aminopeptidase